LTFKSSPPIITTHWTIIELTCPNKNLPNLYFPLIKIKSCKKKNPKTISTPNMEAIKCHSSWFNIHIWEER
jgi:hypothetical protein